METGRQINCHNSIYASQIVCKRLQFLPGDTPAPIELRAVRSVLIFPVIGFVIMPTKGLSFLDSFDGSLSLVARLWGIIRFEPKEGLKNWV